eukprot:jgi/Tetstr1/463230/TSEL_008161.t1
MGVGEDPIGEDGMDIDAPAWPPADVEAADEGVIRKGDPGDFYMKVIAKKFRGVWHYGVITGVVTEWVLEDYGGATQWRAVFEDGDIVDLLRLEVVEAMAAAQEHPHVDADGDARLVTVHEGDDLSRSGKVTVQSGWVMEDCLHHMETFSILNAGPLFEEARVKAIMTEKELRVPRRCLGTCTSACKERRGRGGLETQRGAKARRPGQRGAKARRPGQRGAKARRPGLRGAKARRPGQRGAKARRPGQRGAKARRPGSAAPRRVGWAGPAVATDASPSATAPSAVADAVVAECSSAGLGVCRRQSCEAMDTTSPPGKSGAASLLSRVSAPPAIEEDEKDMRKRVTRGRPDAKVRKLMAAASTAQPPGVVKTLTDDKKRKRPAAMRVGEAEMRHRHVKMWPCDSHQRHPKAPDGLTWLRVSA